ncbi:MmcQ/YjbR family DNA-binding protein [Corynebacterium striatum]
MEAEALHTAADHAALALADAESYRFVEGWHAWRVGGKWFMLASEYKGQRVLILKAPPEDVAALQEGYADIGPAYHMNKKALVHGISRRFHHGAAHH